MSLSIWSIIHKGILISNGMYILMKVSTDFWIFIVFFRLRTSDPSLNTTDPIKALYSMEILYTHIIFIWNIYDIP